MLIAVGINTVSAENLKNIQSYTDKNQVIVYLPASEGNAESVSAQIGNDAVVDGEIKNFQDKERILIRLSYSIIRFPLQHKTGIK